LNYNLTDEELIERLFNIPKANVKGASIREMLDYLTTYSSNGENTWLIKELCQRYGEKRLKNGVAFSRSQQIFDHFRIRLANTYQEMFLTITLDNKHRMIKEQIISLGTISQSLVHPREVFAAAIEQRASGIILIHNHPSGDPKPSSQDIEITKRLSEVGNIVGIRVIDHLVIGIDSYFSFVDEELI
jgi:DNA repair protein RadC